jgi:menaquinone-dependent protoporphyrinogen IX oxidase
MPDVLILYASTHPTDTSRDYDYTDWDAAEKFGREFARSLNA